MADQPLHPCSRYFLALSEIISTCWGGKLREIIAESDFLDFPGAKAGLMTITFKEVSPQRPMA